MTATFRPRHGLAQGLTLVFFAIGAAGLLGYLQSERQIPELASPVVAGAAFAPAPEAVGLTQASGAAHSSFAGSGSTGADGPALGDPSLTPTWPFWEFKLKEPVPPREPPLTPLNWRLIGAAQSGMVWQVVILRQGRPAPEFFRVGETLPGGYFIEAISEEDVTLVHRRRRMIVAYIGS